MGNFLDDLPEKKDIVIVHTFGQELAPVGNYWDSYETLYIIEFQWGCLPSQDVATISGWVKTLVPSEPQNNW